MSITGWDTSSASGDDSVFDDLNDVMTPKKYFKLARRLFEKAQASPSLPQREVLWAEATAAAAIGTLAATLPAAVWFEGDDDGNQ